jgi:hypothetical protein
VIDDERLVAELHGASIDTSGESKLKTFSPPVPTTALTVMVTEDSKVELADPQVIDV